MARPSFRFLHASDFHLEQPPHGLTEIPEHLQDVLIDAPLQAAERVFEAAVLESVSCVLLAGNILQPHEAGPHAISFLLEQFERLEARQIPVYWATGLSDARDGWPESISLPANVHWFPAERAESHVLDLDGVAVAELVGRSSSGRKPLLPAEFGKGDKGRFRVAVAHGKTNADALTGTAVDYWALGGNHRRKTLAVKPHVAHYPGSPQGRSPRELGPHGCTVVQVGDDGTPRMQMVAADSVRWHHERLALGEDAGRGELERLLKDRLQNIVADAGQRHLLVTWTLACGSQLAGQLRRGSLRNELLHWLRREYGHANPAAWSVDLQLEPIQVPEAWCEEDTILGDFLRAVRDAEQDGSNLQLEELLTDRQAAGLLGAASDLSDDAVRKRVLRDAALLGADLLRGVDEEIST